MLSEIELIMAAATSEVLMGRIRKAGARAAALAASTVAALGASVGVAVANPPQPPPTVQLSIAQKAPVPLPLPIGGEADLALAYGPASTFGVTGAALDVTAPAGTEFVSLPALPYCSPASAPITHIHCSTGPMRGLATVDLRLRVTDPTATPSGGTATFTGGIGDNGAGTTNASTPIEVVFTPVSAVPMLAPGIGAACALPVLLGALGRRRSARRR